MPSQNILYYKTHAVRSPFRFSKYGRIQQSDFHLFVFLEI
ncbi:hypothetical protein XELAEV_18000806mg [Xenopus laevis]|nr:hypothetical protein XELAEV_18000806mg [Xenopus laevis]